MAGRDERRCQRWAADRVFTAVAPREQRLDVHGRTQVREPRADLADARDPRLPLLGEKRDERRVADVHQVAEHVNIALVLDRRDLDAVHQLHAELAGRRVGGGQPPDRVVVRDAKHSNAGEPGLLDQIAGAQPAVGGLRVRVKIDQGRRRASAWQPGLLTKYGRPWQAGGGACGPAASPAPCIRG